FVAFVRETSRTGAFFYADFTPKYGQHISMRLEYWNERNRIRVRRDGKVVADKSRATFPYGNKRNCNSLRLAPKRHTAQTESDEVNGQELLSSRLFRPRAYAVATPQTPKGINTPGETSAYLRNPEIRFRPRQLLLCGSCLRKQRSLMQH